MCLKQMIISNKNVNSKLYCKSRLRKIKLRKHVNAAFLLSNRRDILGRASVANAIIYSDRRQCCEAVTASSARR